MLIRNVKVTERGWNSHYGQISGIHYQFHRNTLLEYGNKKWVVSTVGVDKDDMPLHDNVRVETLVGVATLSCNNTYEIDKNQPIKINSTKTTIKKDEDFSLIGANDMHDSIVMEMVEKIKIELYNECYRIVSKLLRETEVLNDLTDAYLIDKENDFEWLDKVFTLQQEKTLEMIKAIEDEQTFY